MTANLLRRILLLAVIALPVFAQETTTTATTTAAAETKTTTVVTDIDSSETREQLYGILNRLPPQVAKTLKLDPTLFTNQSYIANYPALASFVTAHPEVPHNPNYYLEAVWIPSDPVPETNGARMWNRLIETISIFGAFMFFGGVFIWLIKTVIDHRRWNRLSRMQSEVHNKLLDRFAANEDLLKYVNTPAGRHFLESAPIQLETPRAVAAPISRVLWSVQVGIVLAAAGIGMQLVGWSVTDKEVAQPLSAMGTLGITIGAGFVVSAVVSYVLSRRLGLWQPPAEATTGE
ncbi:MAG TPA: hypothetical protein VKB93_09845 [Thermoanaerobaculia bacterium]|nr:hypothetical protein [Thermoanaerobaculia bacterium]